MDYLLRDFTNKGSLVPDELEYHDMMDNEEVEHFVSYDKELNTLTAKMNMQQTLIDQENQFESTDHIPNFIGNLIYIEEEPVVIEKTRVKFDLNAAQKNQKPGAATRPCWPSSRRS